LRVKFDFREYEIAKFTAPVEVRARGGIAIKLPFDPDAEWGDKAVHHVRGSVKGTNVRGALTTLDGWHYLELGPAWCRDAHLEPGTPVNVVLVPEGPQYETLAADLAAAFDGEPMARRYFESLATFYREGYVRWIEEAKRPETRARRIVETLDALKAGKKQR
jgi:Bacteriocin-protection, YdeI or OmpD-Associated/Domain of unknown function (DUF1905)